MEAEAMTALETAAAAVRLYAESHPRPPHVTQAQAGLDKVGNALFPGGV